MLMTVLVLVFFASVIAEKTTAKAATSGVSARQLAQSAVQIVEGTISQATVPSLGVPTATAVAWASQPGMIRTYGVGDPVGGYTASSAPLAYYKLYSSSNMIVNSTTTPPIANYPVDGSVSAGGDICTWWDKVPALYTDLNAPSVASDGSTIYPIVDPRAKDLPVEGFSYSATTPGGTSVDGVSTTGTELLPMPVQWIYVLQDGTLTSPAEPTTNPGALNNTANFAASVNPPTATNPIVGRIAFWTDDENLQDQPEHRLGRYLLGHAHRGYRQLDHYGFLHDKRRSHGPDQSLGRCYFCDSHPCSR